MKHSILSQKTKPAILQRETFNTNYSGIYLVLGILSMLFVWKSTNAQSYALPVANPFGLNSDGTNYNDFEIVDIDNDGDFDLFKTFADGETTFYLNEGNGKNPSFADPQINAFFLTGVDLYYPGLTSADLDSDGDFDMLMCSFEDLNGSYYFENDGSPTKPHFKTGVAGAFNIKNPGFSYLMIPTFVDIDGDSDLDLFISDLQKIYLFMNVGSSSEAYFQEPILNPFGLVLENAQLHPEFADFDHDGDVDLLFGTLYDIISGSNAVFYYHENTGSGSYPIFTTPGIKNPFGLSAGYYHSNPKAIDLDSDGDLDLIVEIGGGFFYYQNKEIELGLDEALFEEVFLFPNPATERISVSNHFNIDRINVYSISGKFMTSIEHPENTIDIYNLETGLYFFHSVKSDGSIRIDKIEVQNR